MRIDKISTEGVNKNTIELDVVSTLELVKMINKEDEIVSKVVLKEAEKIAILIEKCASAIKDGGRVVYIGAGTSGRLGILDASEIFPTFGEKNLFVGLIAGGRKAIETPVENAEDNEQFAIDDMNGININKKDILIGIAASGRTPYVISAVKYAHSLGLYTASISTSEDTELSKVSDMGIEAVVGPEVLTGSTRMKSGTAQKMILNIISTGTMVRLNKVYSNLMVDVKATNKKLIKRAIKTIERVSGFEYELCSKAYIESGNEVKIAIVMLVKNLDKNEAILSLENNNGSLRETI